MFQSSWIADAVDVLIGLCDKTLLTVLEERESIDPEESGAACYALRTNKNLRIFSLFVFVIFLREDLRNVRKNTNTNAFVIGMPWFVRIRHSRMQKEVVL